MNTLTAMQEFDALRIILREENRKQYSKQEYVQIGDFSYGFPSVRAWDEGAILQIGKFCSFASGVIIMLGGEHRVDWNSTYPFNDLMRESFSYIKGHPHTKGDVKIGNDVWIGSEAKIMSGVTIADGCVVGANALVTKDISEPYTIVGGIPAKIIRKRFSDEITKRLCEMKWWDWKDEDIVAAIPLLQSNDISGLWNYYRTH